MNSSENAGVGGTRLPAPYSQLAYNTTGNGQNVMVTESSILSSKIVNETRFQFFRNWNDTPGNMLPQINVAGAFVAGGNGLGNTHDETRHFELQNNTSIAHGAHTIRFGGDVNFQHPRHIEDRNNTFTFNGSATILNGGPGANPYNALSDFLLGTFYEGTN